MREERQLLKASELDITGSQFGIRFKGPLIELYTEDDENWFHVKSFHTFWITDLIAVLCKAINKKLGIYILHLKD